MSLVVSIYYILLLLFISNGYCGSLEDTLGQNKEINNGVINRLLSKSIKRKLLSGTVDLCPPATEETKLENEACSCHEQCQGYEFGATICCEGICRQKHRSSGTSCSCAAECSSGCCENGKCVSEQKDFFGLYWCPAECVAAYGCKKGTCPNNRSSGTSCSCAGQCSSGCCEDGKCVSKLKDWFGVYLCPAECVAAYGCKTGTCPNNRTSGTSCSCAGQCASGCCEDGKCVSKKKDWANTYWCPAECKNCEFPWCKAGTC